MRGNTRLLLRELIVQGILKKVLKLVPAFLIVSLMGSNAVGSKVTQVDAHTFAHNALPFAGRFALVSVGRMCFLDRRFPMRRCKVLLISENFISPSNFLSIS